MLDESEVSTAQRRSVFAAFETTSNRDALLACVARDDRIMLVDSVHDWGTCRGIPCFELVVRSGEGAAPVAARRSFLSQLADAADRGMLTDFRIVSGIELLQRHAFSRPTDSVRRSPGMAFDETARSSQPDV